MTKASGRVSPRAKRSSENGREVERRLAAGDELGDVLADRRRLLEAVAGEAGRVEEARRLGGLADDRVVVRATPRSSPTTTTGSGSSSEHRQPPRRGLGQLLERLLAAAEDEARALRGGSRSRS